MNKTSLAIVIILILGLILIGYTNSFNEINKVKIENDSSTKKVETFEEITLSKYKDKEFNNLWMDYFTDDDLESKYTFSSEKTLELLNYFKSFEYINVNDSNLSEIYDTMSAHYEIRFKNDNSSHLKIEILNKKYIVIGLLYVKEIKDDSKDITHFVKNREYVIYKLHNKELDIKYIKSIFNSIK